MCDILVMKCLFLVDYDKAVTFSLQIIDDVFMFSWFYRKVLIFHLYFEYVPLGKQAPDFGQDFGQDFFSGGQNNKVRGWAVTPCKQHLLSTVPDIPQSNIKDGAREVWPHNRKYE